MEIIQQFWTNLKISVKMAVNIRYKNAVGVTTLETWVWII
jgi:hypothetical protein